MQTEFKDRIYNAIEAACLMEGGDGDTLVQVTDWNGAADGFADWLKRNGNTWWTRHDRENGAVFFHGQENIWFAADSIPATFVFVDKYGFLT